MLRDINGLHSCYEAIAIIEHQGDITRGGDTQGHYICDIRDKWFRWYRTNDNKNPIQLKISDVSRTGYAILYRRVSNIV